jgi:alpha-N-arabinofuranosidase
MEVEPILAVWAGYYLDGQHVTCDVLPIYVQSAVNELEFLLVNFTDEAQFNSIANHPQGPTSTRYGALRESFGYPDPFTVNYVEIGNGDFFDSSGSYQSKNTLGNRD